MEGGVAGGEGEPLRSNFLRGQDRPGPREEEISFFLFLFLLIQNIGSRVGTVG